MLRFTPSASFLSPRHFYTLRPCPYTLFLPQFPPPSFLWPTSHFPRGTMPQKYHCLDWYCFKLTITRTGLMSDASEPVLIFYLIFCLICVRQPHSESTNPNSQMTILDEIQLNRNRADSTAHIGTQTFSGQNLEIAFFIRDDNDPASQFEGF